MVSVEQEITSLLVAAGVAVVPFNETAATSRLVINNQGKYFFFIKMVLNKLFYAV
jgi:hypothetical protein